MPLRKTTVKSLRQSLALPLIAFAALLSLAACDNSYGMFATLQEQQAASMDSKFKKAVVKDFSRIGNTYYARLVSLYERPVDGVTTSWAKTALPDTSAYGSGGTSYTVYGFAQTSNALYIAVREGTASSMNEVVWYRTSASSTWQKLTSSSSASIVALYASNNQLFAAKYDSSALTYSIAYWDGSAFSSTGLTGLGSLPVGGVYTFTDGKYWFAALANTSATTSTVYNLDASFAASTNTNATGISKIVTCMTVANISASSKENLALGTKDGYVYLRSAAGVWTSGALATRSGNTYCSILSLSAITSASGSTVLLAGSGVSYSYSFGGYTESIITDGSLGAFINGDSSSALLAGSTPSANYAASLLYLPVFRFYYDATAKKLFACASATDSTYAGLWSNSFTSGWGGWVSE